MPFIIPHYLTHYSVTFVPRPSPDLEIDRADKIIPVIEIHFDFLFSIVCREKSIGCLDQTLITPCGILAQLVEYHDHADFDFLEEFWPYNAG